MLATRPRGPRARAKVIPFESGVSTGPLKQQRFTVSFYLTAMLFIVFDIEIVFLYPVALWLDALGTYALAEFGFFIAILAVAYVYVWKKGALEWRAESARRGSPPTARPAKGAPTPGGGGG